MKGKELLRLGINEIKDYIESHPGPNIELTHVSTNTWQRRKKIHKLAQLRLGIDDGGDKLRITLYSGNIVLRGKVDLMTGRVLELTKWRLERIETPDMCIKTVNVLLEIYDRQGVS